jgi:hypothetical protein
VEPRTSCTSTTWRLAVVLRTWFVAFLAFPALGFGPSPPPEASFAGADPGVETSVRAAAPLPNADGKPVDALATGETEEEEDASKRNGVHARGPAAEHGVVLAAVRAFDCTAPELAVPCTPQLEHRLHNRGPPHA